MRPRGMRRGAWPRKRCATRARCARRWRPSSGSRCGARRATTAPGSTSSTRCTIGSRSGRIASDPRGGTAMARHQTLPEDHDAQRALEQRSLRNVRALLDKLEEEAVLERKTRKRLAWVVGVLIAAALVALYALAFNRAAESHGRVIVIPAAHR